MTRIKPTKRTTIYDLAHLAGTSASAVSAVLNGNWKKRRISSQLAEKITRIAEEQGYALNMQASLLRREKSKIIGMIVPKYDNRYFGSIVEMFEAMARERGLFPIITCTRRDPPISRSRPRTMLSYQCDWMVATGATDPDRITEICAAAGVGSLNLDLPGSRAPSVISDNYAGARELTLRVLKKCETRSAARNLCCLSGGAEPITTPANVFAVSRDAHEAFGVPVDEHHLLACGYAPDKAAGALRDLQARGEDLPHGLFVNSTISLEGVMRWMSETGHYGDRQPVMGCFDWDPFVALLGHDIEMVRQDVPAMLKEVFDIIDTGTAKQPLVEIPPIFIG